LMLLCVGTVTIARHRCGQQDFGGLA